VLHLSSFKDIEIPPKRVAKAGLGVKVIGTGSRVSFSVWHGDLGGGKAGTKCVDRPGRSVGSGVNRESILPQLHGCVKENSSNIEQLRDYLNIIFRILMLSEIKCINGETHAKI
jgi:hypothetical protein